MVPDDGRPRYFVVVKVHHERSWLRQRRVLVVTADEVMKASADAIDALERGDWPEDPLGLKPSKRHPLSSLTAMALSTRENFSLQFKGDHPYYYSAANAIEITRLLYARQEILRSAYILLPGNTALALSALRRNDILLPGEIDVSRLETEKLDMIQCLHAGALDDASSLTTITAALGGVEAASTPVAAVSEFRQKLSELRSCFVHQLLTRERSMRAKICGKREGRKLPQFDDESDATLCVEEALQNMVISRQVFHELWSMIGRQFEPEQRRVDSAIAALSSRPVDFFGIHRDFEVVQFDLVRWHLARLDRCFTPSGMLDVVLSAVKSIVVCVEAHFAFQGSETNATGKRTSEEYTTDDVLPMLVYILVCGAPKNLAFARRFVELVGENETTERAYYFTVFSSAIEFLLASPDGQVSSEESCSDSAACLHSPFSTPRFLREPSSASSPRLPR